MPEVFDAYCVLSRSKKLCSLCCRDFSLISGPSVLQEPIIIYAVLMSQYTIDRPGHAVVQSFEQHVLTAALLVDILLLCYVIPSTEALSCPIPAGIQRVGSRRAPRRSSGRKYSHRQGHSLAVYAQESSQDKRARREYTLTTPDKRPYTFARDACLLRSARARWSGFEAEECTLMHNRQVSSQHARVALVPCFWCFPSTRVTMYIRAVHFGTVVNYLNQEEGRTALSLALLEQREDIADLIISIDDTDINAPDAIVSTATSPSSLCLLPVKAEDSRISNSLPHKARTQIHLMKGARKPVLV